MPAICRTARTGGHASPAPFTEDRIHHCDILFPVKNNGLVRTEIDAYPAFRTGLIIDLGRHHIKL